MVFWVPILVFSAFMVVTLVIVPWWMYRRGSSSTRPQITIRQMLWLTFVFAALLTALLAFERWHAKSTPDNEQRLIEANRQNEQRRIEANRRTEQRRIDANRRRTRLQ